MKDWQDYIEPRVSTVQDSDFICDASQLGLILVTGDDAGDFLQNQLSNDIREIDENHFQLSAYSTPKGRMLAIFRVIRIANGYLLVTPRSLLESLIERLQRYVVGARVSLADASDHFCRFGIQTAQEKIVGPEKMPAATGEVYQSDSLIVLNPGPVDGQSRFLLLGLSLEETRSLWEEFSATLKPATFDAWRLSEIRAGIPTIYPQTSEEFVAQMSNLNLLGGVNFRKGCYPGQEIVARMQYLGKLKRRMFLARLVTDTCPRPGDDLVTAGGENADGSGKVVDAVIDPSGHCLCLYIARIDRAKENNLRLLGQPGVELHPLDLPYPVVSD